ncbi:MAG TPA: PilZ domain-containing protein [Allosphingosinicella sp.]|jgi:hypothetical protein|uniref:PilZ domain-containing protein n=1 Tax=Allosphingosinicella sp. TaxID=2823234 RepID=UPI002F2914CC
MQHQTLPDPAYHRVRSADRSDVAIPCTVVRIEQPDCQGEVRNLSPGGALLIASEALPANSFVSLRFGEWEPVSAQVKWSDGEQCGCRFVRSLTVRQYLRLRQGEAFEATPPEKTSLFDKVRKLLPRKAA